MLEHLNVDLDTEWGQQLHDALLGREDAMADLLRLAAAQFGMYPQIVSKVLMDVGMGTAPSPEAEALINHQFAALMAELQEQHRRQQGDD